MMVQFRCSSTADVVVAAYWAVACLIALSGSGGGMNFANAQAPLIRVAQGVVSGLDAYTPCTLIDGGSRLACATGSSNGASKMVTFYKNLYAALPALDKAIDYGVSTWNSKGPIYVAGNSEQFLLVSTEDAVYLGAVQVESKVPIRPIRRLGVQTAVQPFFALFFSDSLVIATEHRYVPGMYLRAATINLPGTGDYFVAAVLSLDDNVLLLTTRSMIVKKLEISVNGLGRITTTSVMSDFLFQVQVPWRDVGDDTFYFVRERGPNYGAGGFREVFLSSNYLSQRCDTTLCTTCSCPDAVSKWYVLTQSYPTPYCPGVRLNTYDAALGDSLCAIFSPDLSKYAVTPCDFRTGFQYEDKNPTKFTPNCSAPRNRGAPYLNTSLVTSSSLFALPSGSASVTDVVADTYGPAFSVPTFMAPQSSYSDATMIIINGVVVITAFLQGMDCSTGLSTNTYVAGAAICIPNTRGTRFTVVIPLLGDPSISGSPRRVKQYLGYQVSSFTSSYTTSGDRALPQIVYQALNGSAVVSSVGFAAAPLIPPLSSPTTSPRLVTSQQLANVTFSQSYYTALAAYNGFNIDDVLDNNDILYVSQGQSSGTRAALFKRPTQQIQTSSFYFTTMAENQWFNESVLYATCATQFTVRVMIVNTAVQDGVITSGLYQVVDPPLYAPSTMVLDSAVTFAGSTGVSMALFSAPCTVTTVVTITLRLSSNPSLSFKVNLTLLPGGQMPPTVGPTPIPTPAPPPPPTKTKPRETITQTCSEFLSSASPSETETNEQTLTGTLLESQSHFPTQSQETHSVTDTHDADVSRTLLHVTPEPTISSKLAAFPPLPENATNWTYVMGPQLPFPQGPVLLIQQLSSRAPPPSTFAVRVALPFSGVGQLFTRIAPSLASGSILTTRIDGVELLLRTTNATEALLFINASVTAVLNPEVDERNLTSRIPVNVTVWGEQILSTAAANNNEVRVAGWDSWWYPLSNSIAINRGPKISPLINCSRSVMRGGRFDLSLGSVLTHPLHMPLSMSVVGSGQQITIPASIRVDCNITGSCGIRGVATDDTPIQYRIGGSDGYYSVFASCTLTPFYVSLRASSDLQQQQPLVLNVKAAASFVLTIPLDLFISSLPITKVPSTMIAVTLDDGYPLPASINFAQPNTLKGNHRHRSSPVGTRESG